MMDENQNDNIWNLSGDEDISPIEGLLDRHNIRIDEIDSTQKIQIGRSHYNLAKVYYDKSDLIKAEMHFLEAIKYTEYPADLFNHFKILGFLVRIASEQLDSEKAGQFIEQSELIIEQAQRELGTLNSEFFYNNGVLSTYKGEFSKARENFLMANQMARRENEPELLAKTLHALANNYLNSRELATAQDYIKQLQELLTILQKKYLLGSLHLLAGNLHGELGEFEQAIENFKQSNLVLQDKSCWNLYGYNLLGQGVIYKKMGEFNKALLFFHLALEVVDAGNFKRLTRLLNAEIADVNDSAVDLYLDREKRMVYEKVLGPVDFKHRFVLLEILFMLAKNPGKYYDKEDLAKSIWKDEYNPLIHDKLIYTSVSRLRKLIEPKGEKRKYILRGKDGYTFNANTKIRFKKTSAIETEAAIGNVDLSSPV